MGEQARIALGACAAAGIVIVTYLLVKRLGPKKTPKKDVSKQDKASGDWLTEESTKLKKTQEEPTAEKVDTIANDVKSEPSDKLEEHSDSAKKEDDDKKEEDSSTSTIVAAVEDVVESVKVPETFVESVKELDVQAESDNLLNGKKAEHSSDESSYDVIEDEAADDVAKTDDVQDENDTEDTPNEAHEPTPECEDDDSKERGEEQTELFHDTNESSMVVVDEVLEKSSTSYYTSADESVEIVPAEKPALSHIDGAGDIRPEGQAISMSNESGGDEKTLLNSVADESVVFVDEIPKENIDDSVIFMGVEKAEQKIDDDLVLMGEEKPEQKEMEESVDLSSWQKAEDDVGSEGNNAEMSSWLEVTEESAKEAEGVHQQQEEEAIEPVEAKTVQEQPITEDVGSADILSESFEMPSEERMMEAMNACQMEPSSVKREHLDVLAAILSRGSSNALEAAVLDSLVRVSAFTQHMVNIRDCGFPDMITSLTMESCQRVMQGESGEKERLGQLCQVVTNFSLDPKTMAALESVVPPLVNVACLDSISEVLQMSLLQPLMNFSSTSAYLHHFHCLVQPLLSQLESGTSATRIKVLKVLVNISLDVDMLPHLLAAKAPANLLDLLDLPTSNDVILRTVTFLANIEECLYSSPRAPLALPVEEKVESPLTMHVALLGVDGAPQLRNKVFRLTRHADEDIVFQASRLYKVITAPPK